MFRFILSILKAISNSLPDDGRPSVLTYRTDKSEREYQEWYRHENEKAGEFWLYDDREPSNTEDDTDWYVIGY